MRSSRARSIIVCFGLVLVAPTLAADGGSHIPDPTGDQQDEMWPFWASPVALTSQAQPECVNPSSDIVDIASTASAQALRVEFIFADPSAPVVCEGVAIAGLEHVDGFPSNRFSMAANGGPAISGISSRDTEGTVTQCLRYGGGSIYEVCTTQTTPWIEIPTLTVFPDGRTVDLRGLSLRVSAYNVDSYGTSQPKGNLFLFWDWTSPPNGYPLHVPSS